MIGLATDIRNLRLNVLRDRISGGKLCIYGGDRPYTGGQPSTKLAEFSFADPCAADAEDGMLIFDALDGTEAKASGKATWARIVSSRGQFVADCSVGKGEGDIQLKTVDLFQGMKVTVVSGSISEGNAG